MFKDNIKSKLNRWRESPPGELTLLVTLDRTTLWRIHNDHVRSRKSFVKHIEGSLKTMGVEILGMCEFFPVLTTKIHSLNNSEL